MSDEAERIRREMQNVRQEMGHDVKGIVQGAKQLSDWRYYVRQRPWACMGAAFALGVMVMPAKKKLMDTDVKQLLAQLRSSGLAAAAGQGTSPAGMVGKLLAIAAPLLLRSAASTVAHQFVRARSASDEAQQSSDSL